MSLGLDHSSTNTTSSSSGSTTGQVSKTLSPEQAQIQPSIFATLQKYMLNPHDAINPSRMAARDAVTQDYAGLANQVRQQFLTTGGGASGKAGEAQLQGSLGQAGALSKVDQSAAEQEAALPLTAEQLAAQFLGINMGQTSSGTTNTTGTSKSSKTGFSLGVSPLNILGGFAAPGGGGGGGFTDDAGMSDTIGT